MFCRSFSSGKFEFVSGKCQGILFFPFCMNPDCNDTSFLTVCQSHDGRLIMKDFVQWNHIYGGKISVSRGSGTWDS